MELGDADRDFFRLAIGGDRGDFIRPPPLKWPKSRPSNPSAEAAPAPPRGGLTFGGDLLRDDFFDPTLFPVLADPCLARNMYTKPT